MEDEENRPLTGVGNVDDPIRVRRRKLSILVSLITMFLGSVMFSITLPSMVYFYDIVEESPLIEAKDPNNVQVHTEGIDFYGFIVAIFSFGQAISSPPFGAWYNRRSAKGPYICGLLFLIGGSILYFFTYTKEMMLVARLLVGIGAGTATVCRSHVANATPIEKRTGAMALVAAAQAVGFIIGPAFALIFSSVNVQLSDTLFFDEYTAPGLSSACFGALNLVLVVLLFHEDTLEIVNKLDAKQAAAKIAGSVNDDDADDAPLMQHKEVNYDKFAIFLNMIIFFFVTTGFSVFEAIGTPFTSYNFKWTVQDNSIFFTVAGCASIVSFILVKPLAAKIGDRMALFVGLLLMSAGLIGRLCFSSSECIISEVQYWTTTFCLYTIGYPISNAVCFGIFSKIMGPAAQGTMTGWQMLVGSVARMVGPMWATALFDLDPRGTYVFGTTAGCTLLSAAIVAIWWKRFVPYDESREDPTVHDKDLTSPVGAPIKRQSVADYGAAH